jgi:hypothetical protein
METLKELPRRNELKFKLLSLVREALNIVRCLAFEAARSKF